MPAAPPGRGQSSPVGTGARPSGFSSASLTSGPHAARRKLSRVGPAGTLVWVMRVMRAACGRQQAGSVRPQTRSQDAGTAVQLTLIK